MTKSLTILVQEFHKIEQLLLESAGEITSEIEQLLFCTQADIKTKVDNYAILLDRSQMAAIHYRDQAKKREIVARGFDSIIESIKNNLKIGMQALGTVLIEGEETQFRLSIRAPKLILTGEPLDSRYVVPITILEPNKELIRRDLEQGVLVRGARLEGVLALLPSLRRVRI